MSIDNMPKLDPKLSAHVTNMLGPATSDCHSMSASTGMLAQLRMDSSVSVLAAGQEWLLCLESGGDPLAYANSS